MAQLAFFARSTMNPRLEEQLRTCRTLAHSKGLDAHCAKAYVERSRRGVGAPEDRPEFSALLYDICCGRCDILVCESLIVLTADMSEFAEFWSLARRASLRIITADGVDTGSWRGRHQTLRTLND